MKPLKPVQKCILRSGAAILLIYLLGFIVLWPGGGYLICHSGRTRDQLGRSGLTLADTAEWQPLLGMCQPEYQWPGVELYWRGGEVRPRCDLIGWAYYPLWLVVKKQHPTYSLFNNHTLPFDTLDPTHLPSGFKFHPLRGDDLKDWLTLMTTEAPNKTGAPNP